MPLRLDWLPLAAIKSGSTNFPKNLLQYYINVNVRVPKSVNQSWALVRDRVMHCRNNIVAVEYSGKNS